MLLLNFWPIFLIKFLKNPKIAKNNKNPKKYVFNIFISFLAFLASSQKNLIFQKKFKRVRIFTYYFWNHWFFWIDYYCLFLKIKKNQNL